MPSELVVDPTRKLEGSYATITEAIAAALPHDRIRVRPGAYEEGLVITKPLTIFGDGDANRVRIKATGKPTLVYDSKEGPSRVAKLTLIQGGGGVWNALEVLQGDPLIEECDIMSETLAAVGIHGASANPTLRKNRIFDSHSEGISCYDYGTGCIEDNKIFGNKGKREFRRVCCPAVHFTCLHPFPF